MNFTRNFFATGIGSLPFLDQISAVEFVLQAFHGHVPFWPQLPKASFLESMHIQFCEGFPGTIIDNEHKNITVNTQQDSFVAAFEQCYHAASVRQAEYFAMTPAYACGFHEFIKQLPGKEFPFIKGQVIGPVSFGMTLLDERRRPLLFNAELREIIPLFLSWKARWQLQKLQEASSAKKIVFIDEPYLVAVGTNQFASFGRDTIIGMINSVAEAIHEFGALVGMHCCGNTDWSLCLETGIDILSFDAFEFFDSLLLYRDSLGAFIKKGGILAFGIVPNRPDYDFTNYIERACGVLQKHRALLANGALITCSCGCGSVPEPFARRAHSITVEIAQACRSIT